MAAKVRRLPPLPSTVVGICGPIAVELAERVVENGTEYWGEFLRSTRTIRIDRTAPLVWQHNRLFHEMAHAMLDDSGLHNLLSDKMQESLADAYASSRMAEMRESLSR